MIGNAWVRGLVIAVGLSASAVLTSCDEQALDRIEDTMVTEQYDATATTRYTWQVEYRPEGVTADRPREGRTETFESSYRVNVNGQPAVPSAGDAADEKGLWWPALPPKPTVDELEARQQDDEMFAEPLIQQAVEYTLTFEEAGEMVTLQTEYPVYREAVKGKATDRSLKLTLGREDAYVWKAEMQ